MKTSLILAIGLIGGMIVSSEKAVLKPDEKKGAMIKDGAIKQACAEEDSIEDIPRGIYRILRGR